MTTKMTMRTIKFRGKSRYERRWIIGALVPNGKRPCIAEFGKLFELTEVDYKSVGQFTGVFDCNGKEIYEGDIIRYYDDVEDELVVRPVEYLNDYCAFCAVHPQNDPDGLFAQWQYEVIGNIHDKPELLKGGNDGERL